MRFTTSILLAALLTMACAPFRSCGSYPSDYKLPAKFTEVNMQNTVDPMVIQECWAKAIEVGGGGSIWEPPTRVVRVPSDMILGPVRFYGMTIVHAMVEPNGKVVLEDTVIIYLLPEESCLLPHVLVHEMLHEIYNRRSTMEADFRAKNPSGEKWVRQTWPEPPDPSFFICN